MSGASIALYSICGRDDVALIEPFADLLSNDEREQARFQLPPGGGAPPLSRLARIALRRVLQVRYGAAIARSPLTLMAGGKPVIAGSEVSFSVSHSDQFAVIAVAPRGIVGVDIEIRRRIRMSEERRNRLIGAANALGTRTGLEICEPVLSRLATPEQANEDFDRAAVAAWTCLEALGKADGRGIHWLLSELAVTGPPRAMSDLGKVPAELLDYRIALCTFGGPGAIALAHDDGLEPLPLCPIEAGLSG